MSPASPFRGISATFTHRSLVLPHPWCCVVWALPCRIRLVVTCRESNCRYCHGTIGSALGWINHAVTSANARASSVSSVWYTRVSGRFRRSSTFPIIPW